MAGRVAVLSPEGQFGTVDEADAEAVVRAGGKVLTKQEIAARATEEAYQKQSTLKKVATVASMAGPLGYPVHLALRADGAVLPPELEAYTQGVSGGVTGGLASVGMKEAIEVVGGKEAATAYGKTAKDVSDAHGGIHTAGEIAGFIGGSVAGGNVGKLGKLALPGAGISAIGGVAEQAAARRLGGVAARGAIGRALATGGELGARGAAEGAIYSGVQAATEDMLGDREVSADKVFSAMGLGALGGGLGGAVLGGTGSLLVSGVKGATNIARSGITKAMTKTESAAARAEMAAQDAAKAAEKAESGAAALVDGGTVDPRGAVRPNDVAIVESARRRAAAGLGADATSEARAGANSIAEVTGTKAEQEAASLRGALEKASGASEQKNWAYDQAWKALGAGQGLQSTSFVKSAERYLPNGVRDVGEVIMRKGVISADDGIINAMRSGTPEAMLPKIQAAREAVGQQIGAITEASPAMIESMAIGKAFDTVVSKYEASAATRPLARSLRNLGMEMFDSLGLDKRTSVPLQDLLRERKALDHIVFENAALDPSLTVQVKRELRGELEGLVVKALDDASGDVPGALRDQYKALKKDYTALSIAEEAAEDSAARMKKAAMFGLRDMIAGAGGGGGVTGFVTATGHKIVRERGNAAAAVLLHRMAELGTLTKVIRAVDESIGNGAKALLAPPAKRALAEPTPTEPLRKRAQKAMDDVAAWQANPEAFADRIARTVEPMQANAPEIAGRLTQRMTSAMAFLASKVPVKSDPDPFDPHPAPRMSDAQADTFMKYYSYVERPMRFFEELERGKITYEGAETIKTLMPDAFAEVQTRTMDGLADLLAQGKKPPFAQRQRLGMLLDFPAVPSQRPEHMKLLQDNVLGSEQAARGKTSGPKRPIPTKTQPSTLDRLEGR
jgi:hypothetical protein